MVWKTHLWIWPMGLEISVGGASTWGDDAVVTWPTAEFLGQAAVLTLQVLVAPNFWVIDSQM